MNRQAWAKNKINFIKYGFRVILINKVIQILFCTDLLLDLISTLVCVKMVHDTNVGFLCPFLEKQIHK